MILVTGATGNVGGELGRQLAEVGQSVRALVQENSDTGELPAEIEIAIGDLARSESLAHALDGIEALFLLGGHRDMPGLMAEIPQASVGHVVLLSSRSVIGGDQSNAIVSMWLRSETAVTASDVPWTILRSSGFMSNALKWVDQLRVGDLVRAQFPKVPIAAIDQYDIAAVATVALTAPGHEGQAYALSGSNAITPSEQVEILAKVLGRELRCDGLTLEETEAELRRENPEVRPGVSSILC